MTWAGDLGLGWPAGVLDQNGGAKCKEIHRVYLLRERHCYNHGFSHLMFSKLAVATSAAWVDVMV